MKTIFSIKNFQNSTLLLAVLSIFFMTSCNKDDDGDGGTTTSSAIASFQYSINADNVLEVTFSNFSQNATAYVWNFGDGNTSTEESLTHTYADFGTYNVVLTATGSDGVASTKSETLNLIDPAGQAALLNGSSSKTWYLQREEVALGVGPTAGDVQWWALGIQGELGDRPCILDDAYTFNADGTFGFDSNNTLYIDDPAVGGWIDGNIGGCFDETSENLTSFTGEDLSSFGTGGDYTYSFDQNSSELVIDGLGAYIGLPNKTELGDNYIPQTTKTYFVNKLSEGDIADTLQLALNATDGSLAWTFNLVSYKDIANLPEIPSSVPVASFSYTNDGFTYTFSNFSSNETSNSWDFGDGNTSAEESPVHTFAGEGVYEVVLTVSDDNGNTSVATQTVVVSNATFSAAAFSSESGKVWTLSGNASYYVGPAAGSSEWFSMNAELTANRACQTNDEFIFFDNGDFNYDTKGDVYESDFMCGSESCVDESALTFPAYGSGSYAYSVSGEGVGATITVTGEGAFIGFNKGFNGGEVACADANIPSSITYQVLDYASANGKSVITIAVDISANSGGTAWWTMELESVE